MLRTLQILFALVVVKTILFVVWTYRDYFPPDFRADFLLGRKPYFFGPYSFAFYAHILSGPASLIMGLLLTSRQFLRRYPFWHRRIGKAQVVTVLFFVVPSGLWMARYAMTGAVAAIGFGTLSIATGVTVAIGWRRAVQRKFKDHQRWMTRCYALLCSAVVLRMFSGLSELLELEGVYPIAAWVSWLLPLAVVEWVYRDGKQRLFDSRQVAMRMTDLQ